MPPQPSQSTMHDEEPGRLRELADLMLWSRELVAEPLKENEHKTILSAVLHLLVLKKLENLEKQQKLQDLTELAFQPFASPSLLENLQRLQAHSKLGATADIGGLPTATKRHKGQVDAIWAKLHSENIEISNSADLGYAYQFFNLPTRKLALASIQTANKSLNVEHLIAFTQLYTPSWIVKFLLEQSVCAQIADTARGETQWLAEHNSGTRQAADIRLLDPACGGGTFLTHAFRMLFECHQLTGADRVQSANKALEQIHGADIDAVALQVTTLSLLLEYIECTSLLPPFGWANLSLVDNQPLGSLSREFPANHALSQPYNAVVTNPPYIGRKLISREQKMALKESYPDCANDLSTPFIARALEMLERGGRLGFITQSSLLCLPSFVGIRQRLLEESRLHYAVELGSGAFPLQSGEKINSVLLVAESVAPAKRSEQSKQSKTRAAPSTVLLANTELACEQVTTFIDVSDRADKHTALEQILAAPDQFSETRHFIRAQSSFATAPFSSFQYACPQALFEILRQLPDLGSVAEVRQGLATTDNTRFLKHWWHVDAAEIGIVWFPYVKGTGGERWSSPVAHVVDFACQGRAIKQAVSEKYPYLKGKTAWVVKNEQFYFRSGLCFSFVSTDDFAVRTLPAGCIFDVAASAIFAEQEQLDFLLAYLNSGLVRAICKLVNPTINMQVGDVKRLPLFTYRAETRQRLSALAKQCSILKSELDCYVTLPLDIYAAAGRYDNAESSLGKIRSDVLELSEQLAKAEVEIDHLVFEQCWEFQSVAEIHRQALQAWVLRCCSGTQEHPAARIARTDHLPALIELKTAWERAGTTEEKDAVHQLLRRMSSRRKPSGRG